MVSHAFIGYLRTRTASLVLCHNCICSPCVCQNDVVLSYVCHYYINVTTQTVTEAQTRAQTRGSYCLTYKMRITLSLKVANEDYVM